MAKQPKKGANEQASKGAKTPKPGNQKVNPEKPSIGAFEIAVVSQFEIL